MKRNTLAFTAALLVWSVGALGAGTFSSFCGFLPYFRDNLTVKVDVPEGKLRIDREGSFRVYLSNTMKGPFYDAQLSVLSDQFDVTVTPSPTWKTFPDVPAAVRAGTREYFTVDLKRKSGVPDGVYDLSLKVYSSRATYRRLAASLLFAEALDEQAVPVRSAIAMDGKPAAGEWADSLLIKDFLAYKQESIGVKSFGPASPTRVHLAADADNLYLLVLFMGAATNGDLKMYVSPEIEGVAKVVTLDQTTGKLTADLALDRAQSVRCGNDSTEAGAAMYEVRIPRVALGVQGKKTFFVNFARTTRLAPEDPKPECSYWRGNNLSVNDPVVYARVQLEPSVANAARPAPPVATGTAALPPARDSRVVKETDSHLLPVVFAMAVDGRATPAEWANSLVLTGFLPYKKDGDTWRSGTPSPTRVQLVADADNLYLLVTFMGVTRTGTCKLYVAADPAAAPAWFSIDRGTGRLQSSASTNGMTSVKCDDDPVLRIDPKDPYKLPSATVYECRIPRKSLGLDGKQSFRANVESSGAFWRGNPDSAADPVTYGSFVLGK